MDKIVRIAMSLEPELLDDFDRLAGTRGYQTRSEAIRDLIRGALVEEQWKDADADVVGTITLIYDHNKSGVQEKLMDLQHRHHSSISSTTHVHMDQEQCLEVMIICGKASAVKKLADLLIAIKGVEFGHLTMTPGSMKCGHCHEHDHDHAHEHAEPRAKRRARAPE